MTQVNGPISITGSVALLLSPGPGVQGVCGKANIARGFPGADFTALVPGTIIADVFTISNNTRTTTKSYQGLNLTITSIGDLANSTGAPLCGSMFCVTPC